VSQAARRQVLPVESSHREVDVPVAARHVPGKWGVLRVGKSKTTIVRLCRAAGVSEHKHFFKKRHSLSIDLEILQSFATARKEEVMFWLAFLGLGIAFAFFKLGALSVWAGILAAGLKFAILVIVCLGLVLLWKRVFGARQ
jgi:hypothetical protein